MKFDVVVGNPPYEKDIYKKFTQLGVRLLAPNGYMAFITPATFMTGTNGRDYRQFLSDIPHHINQLDLLPTGVFKTIDKHGNNKNMLLPVATIYISPKNHDNTTTIITRMVSGTKFTWTTDLTTNGGDDIPLVYSEIGKSIWLKCRAYHTHFDMSVNSTHTRQELTGPNVSFGPKNEIAYYGYTLPLHKLTGKKLLTGVRIDPEGKYEWVSKLKPHSKRYVFKTDTPQFLGEWLASKLFGILLSMTALQSNNTATTVGMLPRIELVGPYSDDRVYVELGLTDAEIKWVIEFGNQH